MTPPSARLTASAVDFVPSRVSSKLSFKDPRDGTEIDIEGWKRNNHDHGPVASLQQPAKTQSSPPPSLDQQCHEQTLGHRPTLFVPPGLRRQDLRPRAELEFWGSPSSTMINGDANTSLTDPYDPYYPSWPPYSCHPSYDYGYASTADSSGPPHSDLDMFPLNGYIPSQNSTPTTPTSSHTVPMHIPDISHLSALTHAMSPGISDPPSPPTTPSSGNTSLSAARLNTNAPTFVPGRRPTKVSIEDPAPLPPHTSVDYPVNRWPIRLESEGAKKKRIAEEEKQRKAKEANETAEQEEQRKEGKEKEHGSYKQAGPEREMDGRGGEGQAEATTMSEADAKKKIDGDVKALFDLRKLDKAEAYFSGLPSTYHGRLVDQLVLEAIKSKDADAALVADFFGRAASHNLCSPASFEAGFIGVAEFLGVIAINTPKAWDFMAMLITATGLDKVGQRRIASKTTDADRLLRNLCVDTGAVEDFVQSLGNSRSTLSSSSSTSGSTLVNCTEPHQKADDAVDSPQHCKSCDTSSAVPSDTRQLYASQIEEYRSREATWVEEVKFLRQQVVVWQELYKQSEKEREILVRQSRDASPSGSS
ncbi:hypothetical protein PC9H_008004 [Pleurotus ostreatus]|uniref:MI domain-containing protein n=1 Tax=Pleurotus ostreatus TaxID=5322 RepID=A0A8H6ZZ93_PLEOS|nr:uncharacterized protein PC9H_008004 [Pleurotus ostreatus]KAF7428772.1 hypothetical protein PC9H_008004 [Pleurotus ostreatus]KAJ8696980.1 hypothetical protein PTI98_006799 [Pleurotus ostreatus]